MSFQKSDWSNSQKTAQLGKALNADIICFVTVYTSGNSYKVEFLDVNTFQKITYSGKYSGSLFSDSVNVKGLKDLEKFSIKKLRSN